MEVALWQEWQEVLGAWDSRARAWGAGTWISTTPMIP